MKFETFQENEEEIGGDKEFEGEFNEERKGVEEVGPDEEEYLVVRRAFSGVASSKVWNKGSLSFILDAPLKARFVPWLLIEGAVPTWLLKPWWINLNFLYHHILDHMWLNCQSR